MARFEIAKLENEVETGCHGVQRFQHRFLLPRQQEILHPFFLGEVGTSIEDFDFVISQDSQAFVRCGHARLPSLASGTSSSSS
jgi:hypothetical protein